MHAIEVVHVWLQFLRQNEARKSISTIVRSKSSAYLVFDFQFSESTFGRIICWRNQRVFEKLEYVIPTFKKPITKGSKLFVQFFQIPIPQIIKPFYPTFCFDTFVGRFVPFVNRFFQQAFYFFPNCRKRFSFLSLFRLNTMNLNMTLFLQLFLIFTMHIPASQIEARFAVAVSKSMAIK